MPQLTAGQATGLVALILRRLGTPDDIASAVAGFLVSSDLSGHPSHGMVRVMDYAERIARGKLDPAGRPRVVTPAGSRPIVLVDGGRGYGHIAADLLTRQLVDAARQHGVAAGAIVNVSHTGRLGEWAETAATHGIILFLCYANLATSSVAPFGGREARLATNPLTFGIPAAGDDSLILDMATSAIAGGKVHQHRRAGTEVPPGALIDRQGRPTTDPAALDEGGLLLPFGGHKGSGLSMVVSLLAGVVAGQAGDGTHGVFAFALDPGCFTDRARVLAAVGRQLDRLRATPPAPGVASVQVPGDYEREARSNQTISPAAGVWAGITALAATLGLREEDLMSVGTTP